VDANFYTVLRTEFVDVAPAHRWIHDAVLGPRRPGVLRFFGARLPRIVGLLEFVA